MSAMAKVAEENKQVLAPLTDDLRLLDLGLDSLSLAILVVRLEDELKVDPFTDSAGVDFPVTLHDFLAAYEHAVEEMAAKSP
jgi:hypothetical protein